MVAEVKVTAWLSLALRCAFDSRVSCFAYPDDVGRFLASSWAVEGQVRPGTMALARMHLYKICGAMQATVEQHAGSGRRSRIAIAGPRSNAGLLVLEFE
jgi:hypothetical protein